MTVRERRKTRKTLRNAPLSLVLCEVRFSPVLSMDSKLPVLQELLRTRGFPGYVAGVLHQLELGGPEPKVNQSKRWLFSDTTRERFLVLTESSLAFEVTNYRNFEDFQEALSVILELVREVVQPSLIARVGVRNINFFPGTDEHPFEDLLRPALLPFGGKELQAQIVLHTSQTLGVTDEGTVQVRTLQAENMARIPPDLISFELESLSQPVQGLHTIIDIDAAVDVNIEFVVANIEDLMWAAHDRAQSAFWVSVTPSALELWGLEDETLDGS